MSVMAPPAMSSLPLGLTTTLTNSTGSPVALSTILPLTFPCAIAALSGVNTPMMRSHKNFFIFTVYSVFSLILFI